MNIENNGFRFRYFEFGSICNVFDKKGMMIAFRKFEFGTHKKHVLNFTKKFAKDEDYRKQYLLRNAQN